MGSWETHTMSRWCSRCRISSAGTGIEINGVSSVYSIPSSGAFQKSTKIHIHVTHRFQMLFSINNMITYRYPTQFTAIYTTSGLLGSFSSASIMLFDNSNNDVLIWTEFATFLSACKHPTQRIVLFPTRFN